MPETTQQLLAGVYTLLRGVSLQKLPYQYAEEQLQDVFKGYVQDEDLEGVGERRTTIEEIDLDEDDTDYLVSLPSVPDFEAVRLEYSPVNGVTNNLRSWYDVRIVPFESWEQHQDADYVAASFYGGLDVTNGRKARLNLTPESVASNYWRLAYKVPLLLAAQLGGRPPLPSNFLPMVKLATAIKCAGIIKDDSNEFKAWLDGTLPIWIGELRKWDSDVTPIGRWQKHLSRTSEPQTIPIRPTNPRRIYRPYTPR